ncbi:MAG: putative N-acetylmannosamine-6-phosphate 2-epimerase [Fimbriimonadales bacterium]
MTRDEFVALLRQQPLVVSVQASEGSAIDDVYTLLRLARASVAQGVRVLRLEGADRVAHIRKETGAATIGLIKASYPDSPVYITPTVAEVETLIDTGCEAIALDATMRARPENAKLREMIKRVHKGGALAMADCDTVEAADAAIEAGADLIGTTLSGYTDARPLTAGPDLDLLREIVQRTGMPVLAEGRFSRRWEVEAALRIGAAGVVVGGAINDPVKNTRALMPWPKLTGNVGAVDIGGTWIRYAVFSPEWDLLDVEREPLPPTKKARQEWIKAQLRTEDVCALGVSTGGTVDPATGEVWTAKDIIPDHIGSRFDEATFGLPTRALDDGLAQAWGHACLPQFAGKRVATLAIGTGVGCGFVSEGRIWMGRRGEYSHVNDLPILDGRTCEEALAGRFLGPQATDEEKVLAEKALRIAIETIGTMWFPNEIVVCGSVGLASWMQPTVASLGLKVSPFGADAGLFGAAALVLFRE